MSKIKAIIKIIFGTKEIEIGQRYFLKTRPEKHITVIGINNGIFYVFDNRNVVWCLSEKDFRRKYSYLKP